jgi:Tol biopolymer transport system component
MKGWWILVLLPALLGGSAALEKGPGGQIVYARKEGAGYVLHAMNADGTGDRALPGQTAAVSLFPACTADGKRVASLSGAAPVGAGMEIALHQLDGRERSAIQPNRQTVGRPCWSPDGKQLAFPAGDQQPVIVVADAAGGASRSLTEPGVFTVAPFWTPDGKAVGYSRLLPDHSEIVLTKLDGSGTETLVTSEKLALGGSGAMSRDGSKLTYLVLDMAAQKASLRIWDIAAKAESILGEAEFVIHADYAWVPTAAWGPEGKSLLVTFPTGPEVGVFRYDLEGKRARLTPAGTSCNGAVWAAGAAGSIG